MLRKCPNCGKWYSDTISYCTFCNKSIDATTDASDSTIDTVSAEINNETGYRQNDDKAKSGKRRLRMLVLFNLVTFLLPNEVTVAGHVYQKFGGLSWITFILFELCFIGHLACTWIALRQKKLSGTFYRISII